MRAIWTAVAAIGVAAAATAGCGSGEDRPGQVSSDNPADAGSVSVSGSSAGGEPPAPEFARTEANTTVAVTLHDYRFTGVPARVTGPNVLFEAKIAGGNSHELEVLDSAGDPVAEIPAFSGGGAKQLAVKLEPGTYTLQCLVKEGSRTHAQLGMKTTFMVE